MLQGLYSIYDRVACEFGPLQHCRNNAVAVRMAQGALAKVSRPDDYSLFHVADFESDTGDIVDVGGPFQVPMVIEGFVEDGNGAS